MSRIKLLDQNTIDQIAAGEVVERPLSVVKELVENAMDAGANIISVEIKDGGISFIRVSDNGRGIEKDQVEDAFLRHATSKIADALDLTNIRSLGFRGEALSSIAAVSRIELITKTKDALSGIHYTLTAGAEATMNEIGAPEGSTFLVRNLFFNVPVRRKFLKRPQTEAAYVTECMERLALSRPDISLKYTNNGMLRFHTSGSGDTLETIYRLFGKDIAANLLAIDVKNPAGSMRLCGYLGRPLLNRSNRNFEFFFVNGRYVSGNVLRNALEDGYHPYVMQHRFPFAVLGLEIDGALVDVNVHPGKMELRFSDEQDVYNFICESVEGCLKAYQHITSTEAVKVTRPLISKISSPEPFEVERSKNTPDLAVAEDYIYKLQDDKTQMTEKIAKLLPQHFTKSSDVSSDTVIIKSGKDVNVEQLDLFEERFLSDETKGKYQVLGQIFGTYWLALLDEQLIFIDQHAAHEKIKYEKLLGELLDNQLVSQNLSPPLVLELSKHEEDILQIHMDTFSRCGFEIDAVGPSTYALRCAPAELFGLSSRAMFDEIMDSLSKLSGPQMADSAVKSIARAACKAAVKANKLMGNEEFAALIDELVGLDNPYFCPHGRPTMISMSKSEIERKFKRI